MPWLRWAQPNLPRPIRVNLIFPIFYLLATLFVTIVPMIATPVETGIGILMILSSIPVYGVFIAWKNKPKWFQKAMGKDDCFVFEAYTDCVVPFLGFLTKTLQKLLYVVRPKLHAKVNHAFILLFSFINDCSLSHSKCALFLNLIAIFYLHFSLFHSEHDHVVAEAAVGDGQEQASPGLNVSGFKRTKRGRHSGLSIYTIS